MISQYALALDLGQVQDHIALAIVGLDIGELDSRRRPVGNEHYPIVWLEHYPKGTRYGQLIDTVKQHLQHPALEGRCAFLVDRGEVGKAVIEQFQDAGLEPIAIQITAGLEAKRIPGGYTVPKKDLVYSLVAAYSQARVTLYQAEKGTPAADAADKLDTELARFVVKAKKHSLALGFEAESEQDHDDLVMAVSMAVWYLREYGDRFSDVLEQQAAQDWDSLRHGL